MNGRMTAPPLHDALFICISPTFQPAFEAVLAKLAAANPKATREQLADQVMAAGITHLVDVLNITVERG